MQRILFPIPAMASPLSIVKDGVQAGHALSPTRGVVTDAISTPKDASRKGSVATFNSRSKTRPSGSPGRDEASLVSKKRSGPSKNLTAIGNFLSHRERSATKIKLRKYKLPNK